MKSKKGFTLIELMIVMAIIGILAGSAFPCYKTYHQRARALEASVMLKQLLNAEIMYYLNQNAFFPAIPGANILIFNDSPPNLPAIIQARSELNITIPVGHMLDYTIQNMGTGVMVTVSSSNGSILFADHSTSITGVVDTDGKIVIF